MWKMDSNFLCSSLFCAKMATLLGIIYALLFCGKTGSLLFTALLNTATLHLFRLYILVLTCFVFFSYGSTGCFMHPEKRLLPTKYKHLERSPLQLRYGRDGKIAITPGKISHRLNSIDRSSRCDRDGPPIRYNCLGSTGLVTIYVLLTTRQLVNRSCLDFNFVVYRPNPFASIASDEVSRV